MFCKHHAARLLFVIIPPVRSSCDGFRGSRETSWVSGFIGHQLGEEPLNLDSLVKREANPSKIFLKGGGHFSWYGNHRVAEEILSRLEQGGYLGTFHR